MLRRSLPFALVLAACALTYTRTIGHEFLLYDDVGFIVENPLVNAPDLDSLRELWTRPLHNLYAPLTYSLWAGLSALFGLEPAAFHAANVLLHALNACMVLVLLRFLLAARPGNEHTLAALAGALLFALHPLQAEAVAWASETKDLLSAFFSLVAIRLALGFFRSGKRTTYLAASLAFLLALLAKPSVVYVPAIVAVLVRVLTCRSWREIARAMGPWLAIAALFTLMASHAQPGEGLRLVPPLWLRPVLAMDALGFYAWKLLLPLQLVPDYGHRNATLLAHSLLWWSWIPAAALLAAAWGLRKRFPALLAALAVFTVALLPMLGLFPFDFQLYSNVADHYAYLALLGPALGFAFLGRHLRAVRLGAWPLLIGLGFASWSQVGHWKDDETLATYTLEINPRSFLFHNNLGKKLEREGRMQEALQHFEGALEADPDNRELLLNLGNGLFNVGRYDDSIRHLQAHLGPNAPRDLTTAQMHNTLGGAHLYSQNPAGAIEAFRTAIATGARYVDPYYNLAMVLIGQGRRAEAVQILQQGLKHFPQHEGLRAQLEQASGPP